MERTDMITSVSIRKFIMTLEEEEKGALTIAKYRRDVLKFYNFLDKRGHFEKADIIAYKKMLSDHYRISSVNSMLVALNRYLEFQGLGVYRVKTLRLQKQLFYLEKRELRKADYLKLLKAAKEQNKQRLYMIMLTLCATGMRVSELSGLTLEAVKRGQIQITCKNKTRWILIPDQLKKKLLHYAAKRGIDSGIVFVTRNGQALERSNIWKEMKKISAQAGVESSKVFPHNLRHLFARTYYARERDIVKLSNILGHCSIETTRIYTMTTVKEHARQICRLGLIV